ncbi:MAG: hypothetical protein R3F62_00210 [Planctomycetota bacterium]
MDETLRKLERAAAAQEPDAALALYAARLLLGAPEPEPEPEPRPAADPRAEDRALSTVRVCYDRPARTRNQAAARAFVKRRRRRALRRAGRAACWD